MAGIRFGREGDWFGIEDLDEEVAMFDADHGFFGWLGEVGWEVEGWMDGGVSWEVNPPFPGPLY